MTIDALPDAGDDWDSSGEALTMMNGRSCVSPTCTPQAGGPVSARPGST